MLRLPFNKWTLQFYDELHTQKYQTFKNEISEQIIQVECILFSIALSICLIAFMLQHQHISQIITTAFGIIWCLFIFFLRKKTKKFMQHFLIINYLISLVLGTLIQIFQQQIPLFSIGFICGQVLIFCLFFIDFKVKIILLPSTGFIILAIDNLYQSEYFYVIIFQIVSILAQIMLNYIFEFTSRTAFVLNLITIKQQEIINEFVNDGLIGIGFDLQSRQFNLEFKNRTSEYLLNIKDNDTLRQFIRSCIVLNQSSTNKNLDEVKKRPIGKRTLEDFLFARTLEKLSNEHSSWEIEIMQSLNKIEKKLKVQLKTMDFGKPILTLIIKSYEVPKLISKYEQTIKKLQKIITNQSQHYAIISQKLSLELKQISQQMDINLQNLQSSNNLIMNTIKNYIIYFSSSKLDISKENNKMCKFDDFITQIQQFFNSMSQKYQKRIYISNHLQDSQIIKTNLNLLCQLITNLFEQILLLSKDFSKFNLNFYSNSSYLDIQLSINQSSNTMKNNSFVSDMKKDLLQSFDSSNDQQMQIEQEILHFCFSFISDFQILDILNFDTKLIQKQSNLNEYFSISNKVTQYLISLLGPFNDIFTVCDKFQDSYSIQINFYIYKNQSKVLQSFAMQQHYDDLFQGDLDF